MLHEFVGYINYVKCWFCWNGVVRRLFCHLLVPLYSFQDRAADNYRSSVQYLYWCACLCHWVLIKTYLWIHVRLNYSFVYLWCTNGWFHTQMWAVSKPSRWAEVSALYVLTIAQTLLNRQNNSKANNWVTEQSPVSGLAPAVL